MNPRRPILFLRISLLFGTLLVAVAGGVLWLGLRSADLRGREVVQELNRDVAAHMAPKLTPWKEGELVEGGLQGLFMDAMRIHPSLEIYLLDLDGQVLAYDAPPEVILRDRVELDSIREFEAEDSLGLVLGDDPRSVSARKPISVARVHEGETHRGYLYIILGGQLYDGVVRLLGRSAALRDMAALGGVVVLCGCLAGVLGFALLTRPLGRLRTAMRDLREDRSPKPVRIDSRDEIGELAEAYNRMAARITRQIERLKETDELRRELVANLSHDLRTPTAGLQGYLQLLVDRGERFGSEERARYTEVALRQAERLSRLIEQLSQLAHFEARDIELEPEAFSLAELAHDVVQKFELEAREKGLQLQVNHRDDLPHVLADIGLIERAIVNLIENALNHTPRGGRVEVRLAHVRDRVTIRVRDTGRGIPEEALAHVFDRFYRVPIEAEEDPGGTGLGLAITQRILELHRSRVTVASEVGRGTTIGFALAASL